MPGLLRAFCRPFCRVGSSSSGGSAQDGHGARASCGLVRGTSASVSTAKHRHLSREHLVLLIGPVSTAGGRSAQPAVGQRSRRSVSAAGGPGKRSYPESLWCCGAVFCHTDCTVGGSDTSWCLPPPCAADTDQRESSQIRVCVCIRWDLPPFVIRVR